jgi:hypothetical protein
MSACSRIGMALVLL